MAFRKALATAAFSGCLLLQVVVMTPPWGAPRLRYWPFLEYPMYATPHHVGERFELRELRVVPCQEGEEPATTVTPFDLAVTKFVLWGMLDAVDGSNIWMDEERSAESVAMMKRLVASRMNERFCTAQVWQKQFVMGEGGPVDPDPPWTLLEAWTIARRASAS